MFDLRKAVMIAEPSGGLSELVLTFVESQMRGLDAPWWFAGGWAIDLFLGELTRPHGDVDLALLRRDQRALRDHLADWSLTKVAAGVRSPWLSGERLEQPLHEIHAEKDDLAIELLLNDAHNDTWVYRRNPKVRMPLQTLSRVTTAGKPYLCPEVVLLFKSKTPRDVDHADFERVLPRLDDRAVRWLHDAIKVCDRKHEWLSSLAA